MAVPLRTPFVNAAWGPTPNSPARDPCAAHSWGSQILTPHCVFPLSPSPLRFNSPILLSFGEWAKPVERSRGKLQRQTRPGEGGRR